LIANIKNKAVVVLKRTSITVKELFPDEVYRYSNQCPEDSGEVCAHSFYSVLAWRAEANDPYHESKEHIEEGGNTHNLSIGIEGVGVEEDPVGEIVNQVLHQSHVRPGVSSYESDPVPYEYVFIG